MHKNNFDFLRFLFALCVLISHTYVLSGAGEDVLDHLTHQQLSFGSLGVRGFFIISGYLVFESLLRSKNWFDFLFKRALRIYPGLFAVLILTFVLGIFITDISPGAYLADVHNISYVWNNMAILTPQQYALDHVFSNNPGNQTPNLSLWTIPYECLMYVILSSLLIFKRIPVLIKASAFGILAYFLYVRASLSSPTLLPPTYFSLNIILNFGIFFFSGSLLSILNISNFKYKGMLGILCLLCFSALTLYGKLMPALYLFMPTIVIISGSYATKYAADMKERFGDMSYGMYLYGAVTQQTLIYFFHFKTLALGLISIPITILFGYLSWHLIEKRALRFKKYKINVTSA